jgi:hypothetical protein
MFHSFFDCTLLGYEIVKLPLLATICSAVNGLLVNLHRESVHHCLTWSTSCWIWASSASMLDMMSGVKVSVSKSSVYQQQIGISSTKSRL